MHAAACSTHSSLQVSDTKDPEEAGVALAESQSWSHTAVLADSRLRLEPPPVAVGAAFNLVAVAVEKRLAEVRIEGACFEWPKDFGSSSAAAMQIASKSIEDLSTVSSKSMRGSRRLQ